MSQEALLLLVAHPDDENATDQLVLMCKSTRYPNEWELPTQSKISDAILPLDKISNSLDITFLHRIYWGEQTLELLLLLGLESPFSLEDKDNWMWHPLNRMIVMARRNKISHAPTIIAFLRLLLNPLLLLEGDEGDLIA